MPEPEQTAAETADAYITTRQVAAALGVNVATVNRWARTGRLPVAVKAPGRYGANLYRRADVAALSEAAA